ncbi:SDR family oxidoreductase [Rhizobium sp. XQZ8]|uniref:SDR family oxidoreductase n=1 Tax=Rhizobium populisoli TaxID=2859785 RepID=UPI001CA558CE|nr:SDR family oxidoreductase [Rhizobium populisoli]MBW6421684.1 SDR family oxidoreductase [Rhizobium populisoli]
MFRKTWFITGANSGFGRLMAEQLLSRGDRVAATLRKMDALDDLKTRYGDNLWLAELDMTDLSRVRSVVDRAFTELGSIDVIVSNAGYGLFGAAEELTDEQVDHQLATNLEGPIRLIRSALPHLRAQGGGRIIQISTFGGQATLPGGSLYHAGKWGIEGFCDAVAQEVAPFGIDMTIVEPGGARTNFRFGSARVGPALEAYENTPAGMTRKILADTSRLPIGDPAKMVEFIIESANQHPAPRRLVLGSDSYMMIERALSERLEAIRAQKEIAFSTDLPPGV